MSDFQMIPEDVFDSEYKPIPIGENGDLTRSHKDTVSFPVNQVWTIVDGDDGNLYALPGYHIVNRVDYVVTEKPWEHENFEAEWCIFENDEEEGED